MKGLTRWFDSASTEVRRWTSLPDVRDFHIYGGLLLVAVGLTGAFGWWGVAVPGAALFYLGVWRFR